MKSLKSGLSIRARWRPLFLFMGILASATFIIGYSMITLEHRLSLHKSITAILLGAVLWIIVALISPGHVAEIALQEVGGDIFSLIAFLLGAMTLVEILVHYRFFDLLRVHLLRLGLGDQAQLWLISGLTFVLSAVIDNLTATIVMVQIARRFFRGSNLLIAGAAIVVAANAGGAFSPIGDVTTIMLWLAGKYTAFEIMSWGFFPALALYLTSNALFARMVMKNTQDQTDGTEDAFHLTRSERSVIAVAFFSFSLPVMAHLIGLPPYMGILTGLGLTGLSIAFFVHNAHHRDSHLASDIEKLLKGVDFASILFFIGILLAVGALKHLGILANISAAVFGSDPAFTRLFAGSVFLGVFSALVDNIPLTAAGIDIIKSSDPAIWSLLALCVGTGGSLLVIGSAAGVVAMGMLRELTFKRYIMIATLPATVGYVVALAVWSLEYAFFR